MDEKIVLELIRQIGEHSSKICQFSNIPEINLEEIRVQNGCIHDALISFMDLFLPDQMIPKKPLDWREYIKSQSLADILRENTGLTPEQEETEDENKNNRGQKY